MLKLKSIENSLFLLARASDIESQMSHLEDIANEALSLMRNLTEESVFSLKEEKEELQSKIEELQSQIGELQNDNEELEKQIRDIRSV